MAHATFPLPNDGMVVQAVIGMDGPKMAALLQAGKPVPRPIAVRALIDSGSDTTAVAPDVLVRLGLASFVTGTSQTASGPVEVKLYRVSLTLPGPDLALPDMVVSELTAALPVDVLLGLDVLRHCLLILDGPGQRFILGS